MESRMEALEASMTCVQEDVAANRDDAVAIRDNIKELERGQERPDFYIQKIDNMFSMLVALPQFKLAGEFPPRLGIESILERDGILPRPKGIRMSDERGVYERELQGRNMGLANHSHTPVLRLDIPIFEGEKLRWWVRRCERFFELYRIGEEQKVLMAAAYLNDVADAWYQNWRQSEGPRVSWGTFAEELCGRFGEKLSQRNGGFADAGSQRNCRGELLHLGSSVQEERVMESLRSIARKGYKLSCRRASEVSNGSGWPRRTQE
ncbi:uncharacterized protein LOC127812896 [Diospyros lotus]|uniref:uncharacterized protein LOC127812896 n=1 Tax=Diospyros lotus TaxID=55363 RepID=UPI002255221C|nr:uncharacterized protein LOC127812896 [Diospyros lotus]